MLPSSAHSPWVPSGAVGQSLSVVQLLESVTSMHILSLPPHDTQALPESLSPQSRSLRHGSQKLPAPTQAPKRGMHELSSHLKPACAVAVGSAVAHADLLSGELLAALPGDHRAVDVALARRALPTHAALGAQRADAALGVGRAVGLVLRGVDARIGGLAARVVVALGGAADLV